MSRTAPTTFTFFRKLPPEIRVMVYKLMIPGPRRVHSKRPVPNWFLAVANAPLVTFRRELPTRLGSSIPVPAVLHLNEESRYEALKHYNLHFGTDTLTPMSISIPRSIRFISDLRTTSSTHKIIPNILGSVRMKAEQVPTIVEGAADITSSNSS